MEISIINTPFNVHLYGYSGTVENKQYGQTGFKLMDAMWKEIRLYEMQHKGVNHWVYLPGETMFVGVELKQPAPQSSTLEYKNVQLNKYAYYKHIGPYNLLAQVYAGIRQELSDRGLKPVSPGMEIYGHWNNDESKLETEILMSFE